MKKNIKVLLLSASMFVMTMTPSTLKADDFSGQEDYYIQKCSVAQPNQEEADTCKAFKVWMEEQADKYKALAGEIADRISALEGDISAADLKAQEYEAQIEDLNNQIVSLEASIVEIENSIVVLEEQIAQKEADIEERDRQIKEGMVSMQSYVGVNAYIDIIMGASDLIDMIRRISVLQDITAYEQGNIEELNKQIEQLNFDKSELDRLKQEAIDQQILLEQQKASLQAAKEEIERIRAELYAQSAALEEERRTNAQASEEIMSLVPTLKDYVEGNYQGSAGFRSPVAPGNYTISAGTWAYYGTNTAHLGLDFAASIGTPIVAPANCIVAYANNPAPSNGGYLGNWVGWPYGGGNTISLIGEVNGTTYMFSFFHLSQSPWPLTNRVGDMVGEGEIIGYVGHSGNSTGAHLHFEIVNMGSQSAVSVYNWFQSTVDFSGGSGWNTSSACSARGWAVPCRERPEDLLGL